MFRRLPGRIRNRKGSLKYLSIFPQITFTEPVVHVADAGSVTLIEEGEGDPVEVPLKISAVGIDYNGDPIVIEDLSLSPETPITSITLQPLYGLKYSTQYTMKLTSQITDMDVDNDGNPVPNGLKDAPRTLSFKTFGPEQIGAIGNYYGAGIVVLGDRAYVPDMGNSSSWLHVLNISNPAAPVEVHVENIPARAFDIAGVDISPVTGGPMVAVVANSFLTMNPSFVYFLDVSQDQTMPVGATIVTSDITEGVVTRLAMLRDKAYTLTSPKGIQVIDIGIAVNEFQSMVNQKGMSGAIVELVNSQTGAYRGSVVNTIPVSDGEGSIVTLAGIAADDFILDGSSQALVVATGSRLMPLIVVNPQEMGSSALLYYPETISTEAGTLTSGLALTTGFVNEKNIVVVVGTGTIADGNGGQCDPGNVLVVFDMTNPRQPIPIGFVLLDAVGKSVTIVNDRIFVGTSDHAIVVSLKDLAHPIVTGIVENFSGRLDISDEEIIIAADPNRTGVNFASISRCPVSISLKGGDVVIAGGSVQPYMVSVLPSTSESNGSYSWSLTNEAAGTLSASTITQVTCTGNTCYFEPGTSGQSTDIKVTFIPNNGCPNTMTQKSINVIEANLNVMKINHNIASGELTEAQETNPGAFIPINNDDDDANNSEDKIQSGTITGENDLLPIKLYKAVPTISGSKYLLDIPSNIKIWSDFNRLNRVYPTTELPTSSDQTLYVEGVSAGSGNIKVNWKNGSNLLNACDEIKITVFDWQGPLNVPDYSIHQYTAIGALSSSQWDTPVNGTIKTGTGSDVKILWNSGPVIGKAVYQVNADYIWDLEINVVHVKIEAPTTGNAFTTGTPTYFGIYRFNPNNNVPGAIVCSGDCPYAPSPQVPGILFRAKVTLIGPNLNGIDQRGVTNIEVGFVQNLTYTTMRADFTVSGVPKSLTGNIQGNTYLDVAIGNPPGTVYYNMSSDSVFKPIGTVLINRMKDPLQSSDTPVAVAPIYYKQGTALNPPGDDTLDSMHWTGEFNLWITARTDNTVNNADTIYTCRAKADWEFTVNEPYPLNNPLGNTSVTVPSAWTPVIDGSTPTLTGGTTANQANNNIIFQ